MSSLISALALSGAVRGPYTGARGEWKWVLPISIRITRHRELGLLHRRIWDEHRKIWNNIAQFSRELRRRQSW